MEPTTLILRTNNPDGGSRSDPRFVYPRSGPVERPEWWHEPWLCGFAWGQGEADVLVGQMNLIRHGPRQWCVVAVQPEDLLPPSGSIARFLRGKVVYSGGRDGAIALLVKHAPENLPIPWARITVGDKERAQVGHFGLARAADYGTAVSLDHGTSHVGVGGTAAAGICGMLMFDVANGPVAIFRVSEDASPRVGYSLNNNGTLYPRWRVGVGYGPTPDRA